MNVERRVVTCPACLDKLAQDDQLAGSSPDVVDRFLQSYHAEDHEDVRKSPAQLRLEKRARDEIARRTQERQ